MAKGSTIYGQPRVFSNQAPAIQGGSSIPTINFSAGRARQLEGFSKMLFGVSAQMEDQLDQQVSAEAAKEGAIAGMTGNVEEQTYETIRGRAYNKAMLESFVTTLDTQAMVGAARLEQEHYNNPAALEKSMNDFFGGMSDEIDKIAPGAGAAFRARQTARALPAVERARDVRFSLTREAADARLIEYEGAVTGSIKKGAAGLFSSNTALSASSSAAVAQSVGEYMRTYDAVDDVTGKPLYNEKEKAAARVYIRDKVYSEASLAWFDAQDDKVSAYLQAQDPEFKFNFKVAAEKPANVVYENQGSTRSQKVQPQVLSWLSTAGGAMGEGVQVHITSGGQPSKRDMLLARARGEKVGGRTGSNRHDHGGSADVVLSVNGKKVTPQENPALYQQFLENAVAAGATGVGHYAWGVHIGGGSEAAWGADTTSSTLDPAYAAAFARGKDRRKGGALTLDPGQDMTMPLRSQMSEKAWSALDTEMRQRITFANTQAERARTEEARILKENNDAAELEVTIRIWSAGQTDPATNQPIKEITDTEILDLARDGVITSSKAEAFIKAINTEKPKKSEPAVYQELQRRMWNGEDIQGDVLQMVDKLAPEDARNLLSTNNTQNRSGSLTAEESRGMGDLKDLLTPDTMTAQFDTDRQRRRFEALQEYQDRVKDRANTGERIDDITRDIANRYTYTMFEMTTDQLGKLGLPRFFVSDTVKGGRRIDVQASKASLKAALDGKKISQEAALDQLQLIKQWEAIQAQVDIDEAKAASKGKKK